MPKIVTVTLKSNAPYSQSRQYFVEKQPKESAQDYEERTWRERCHYHVKGDSAGRLYIPGIQFKNAIDGAAKMLQMKIPGKGNNMYAKHLLAGVRVRKTITLPETKDTVPGWWGSMNPMGKKGGGKRVSRCYPMVYEWQGEVEFLILDSTVTPEVFERHLREAGNLVGIGRWAPRVGGENGLFTVAEDAKTGKPQIKWGEL